jgi:hypothetical protein
MREMKIDVFALSDFDLNFIKAPYEEEDSNEEEK